MTLTVHHLENSRSQRILWLLEELGVPYEVKRYERDKTTSLAPPELRAVHPLGKSPVITDGKVTVAETGAIIEYLVGKYGEGKLAPKAGTQAHRDYIYWLHYAEGSAMPPLFMKLVFSRIPGGAPALIRPIAKMITGRAQQRVTDPRIAENMAWWEQTLSEKPWFTGRSFTAADVMMSFPVEAANARFGLEKYPHVAAWLEKIHARPAYRRALEAGGPYALMS